MSIKILATGDLHLGKRSSGIPDTEPAGSAIYTWQLIVEWCVQNNVDVLALLGDIVDSENRIYQTINPLFDGFTRLQEKGIQVFMISGNHDHDVPAQIDESVDLNNVTVLGRNGKWETKSFIKNDLSVQFVGWSFPGESVTASPLVDFNELSYDRNRPVIGLLHCDVDVINSRYAPVPLSVLISTHIDAWLLGHIHKPLQLNKFMPMVRYTGSPHAFSAKEPGEHGPLMVTVNGKNDINARTVPLSPISYETISIEIEPNMQQADFRTSVMQHLIKNVTDKKKTSEHLKHVIYDVELNGTHMNLAVVDHWMNEIANSDFGMAHSDKLRFAIRKVSSNVMPALNMLEEYVSENSPVGLLAGTIMAIRENRSTPMLERLMEKWMTNYRNMQSSATYSILGNNPIDHDSLSDLAKNSILKECNTMISELLNKETK